MEYEEGINVLFFDTLLRYYLHIDPWALSDEEWAMTIVYLKEIREKENGN